MYNQFFTIKPRISKKKRRKQSCTPNIFDWILSCGDKKSWQMVWDTLYIQNQKSLEFVYFSWRRGGGETTQMDEFPLDTSWLDEKN